MINHFVGNMLDSATKGYIIHGCNTLGIMGGGIANQVKWTWPEVYNVYRHQYENNGLPLGSIIPVAINDKLTVINCITQDTIGSDGSRYVSYDAIDLCMNNVNEYIKLHGEKDSIIHTPLIGCGLAGGNWNIVEKIIEANLDYKPVLWVLKESELVKARLN